MTAPTHGDRQSRADPAWTPRQREVLEMLARGYSNPRIADALGISLDGAKWHVREIMAILAVDSREEAADYCRARNGLRTRLRRGIATALAGVTARWAAGIAAAGIVAVVATTIVLLTRDDGAPSPVASPAETATPAEAASPGPGAEYLCPFDAPEVCAFAFETAAAFRPPSYGLSQLVAGSAWVQPEYYRQLADLVEAAFRFKSADEVRLEDDGDVRLMSIGCPLHGDTARCEPAFVLTFADFDALYAPEGFQPADLVSLVFQVPGDGQRPVLVGPLSGRDAPPLAAAFVGGQASCNLLGLERQIAQCSGVLFRSALLPRADGATIAGLTTGELAAVDPVGPPEGVILYFNPACYACEGSLRIVRTVNGSDGNLDITELSPLPPGIRGSGPYHMAQAIDPGAQRMAVGVCDTGYCGGIGEAAPGASATLWLSEDGGTTWVDHGPLPVWSSFHGFDGSELMVQTWDDSTGSLTSWLYPSGDPWPVAPASVPAVGRPRRWPAPSGEVYWSQSTDGFHWNLYDANGSLVAGRIDLAYHTRLAAIGIDGTLYLGAGLKDPADRALPPPYYLLALSPSGEPLAAYHWRWGDLRLTAPIAPGVFIGNALFGPYPEPFGGAVNFRPALIDLNAGTVSPIAGLPPDPASGIGGYAVTIVAVPAP